MSNSTYFVQECPTCGRRLHIRVEYLGRKVVCQHCRGQFTDCDPNGKRAGDAELSQSLLRRAEELLQRAPQPAAHPSPPRPR
jgi:hypothetical protein